MSNSLLKSLSLKSLFARAIPLTLGAATLLVVVLICSLIVLEVTTRSLPIAEPREELVLVFDLRERIVIQTSEVSPTHAGFFTLERAVMFPIEPAPTDFVTLGTESLWKRATPNLPRHRVQFVGYSQAVPTCWYFHNHGERAEYVLSDPRTERRLGSVGRHGFKAAPLTPDEQFDTSNHRLNQRIRFGQQHPFRDALAVSNRPRQQRDHDGEFLLQDDDRRVYWINFEKQTSTLLHDGERVLSVVTFPFLDGHSRGIALRLEDRIILKSWWEPFDTIDVIVLPLTVRQQPSFTWVPGVRSSGGSYGEEIYVVAGRTHEIVWAQRTGEVLRQKSVTLRDPRHETNVVDGTLVEIPAYLMWAFGLVQAPAFSWWLIGGAVEPGASIVGGGFDPEVALPAMYGTTQREVWLNTWRANVWPLLATQALALVWVGLGQRRLKRWAATRRERWFWGCWIAVFGLPGYLALRVQRSWPALKTCKACSGEVPCDRAACAKCGAEVVGGRDGEVGRDVRTGRTDGPGDPSYTGERPARRRVGQRLLGLSVAVLDRAELVGLALATRLGRNAGPAVLLVKELRAVTGIALLATVAFVAGLGRVMDVPVFQWLDLPVDHTHGIPTTAAAFDAVFVAVSAVIAVVLGFWQTVPEGWGGAWLFLLHRPVKRRTLMATKLAVGWGSLLALTVWPILVFGWWGCLPGSIDLPFDWSMTEAAWRMWWLMSLLYLGAFASGLRTANWWGSRLMPLFAIGGAAVVRDQVLSRVWPWWLELGLASTLMLLLVTVILTVSCEQDYA